MGLTSAVSMEIIVVSRVFFFLMLGIALETLSEVNSTWNCFFNVL